MDDIRPLTVFIGPSGSGKSTLLKLVVLFRWLAKRMSIRSYLALAGIDRSPFRFRIKDYLRNNGLDQYMRSDSEIIYRFGSSEIIFTKGALRNPKPIGIDSLSLDKLCFVSDKRAVVPSLYSKQMKDNPLPFF